MTVDSVLICSICMLLQILCAAEWRATCASTEAASPPCDQKYNACTARELTTIHYLAQYSFTALANIGVPASAALATASYSRTVSVDSC
jgi:hypothetical protein